MSTDWSVSQFGATIRTMADETVEIVVHNDEPNTDAIEDAVDDAIEEIEETATEEVEEAIEEVQEAAIEAIETVAAVAAISIDDIRTVVKEEISIAIGAILMADEPETPEPPAVEVDEIVIEESTDKPEEETKPEEPEEEPTPDEIPLTRRQKAHKRWFGDRRY